MENFTNSNSNFDPDPNSDTDPDIDIINHICKKLINAKITFQYTISLDNETITNDIKDCNIVGNCIENILFPFIQKEINTFEKGPKQSSPDYWNRNKKYEYDLKCFMNQPNFDIANFISYISQLNESNGVLRKLIKTKYLIFKYKIIDNYIKIQDFTICNVWNMVNYNGKYPISLQNKKGTWYNIRPGKYNDFKNKEKTSYMFINNICDAIKQCPNKIQDKDNIIINIKQQYQEISIN